MPRIGLEPTYLAVPEPKSGVSTNSTTWARGQRLNLKTAVESGKVMQDFESESISTEGHIPQVVKGPSIEIDSDSKDCVNLPLSTAVLG